MENHDYKAALDAFKQQIKEFEQNLPSLVNQDGAFKHYEAAIYALKIADRLMQGAPRSTPERNARSAFKGSGSRMTWQPIETAPKRKQILLYADGYIVSARWKRTQWLYAEKEIDGTDIFFGSPTHWMPLPAPPEEG